MTWRRMLEDDLQRHLHLPRKVLLVEVNGPETRPRSIAESRQAGDAVGANATRARTSEARRIGHVEDFEAVLEIFAFPDGPLLLQRRVEIRRPGNAELADAGKRGRR